MSWSTAEQVAALIQTARLDAQVDPVQRKSADLALVDLFEHAINVGDSLVAVIGTRDASFGLRFNACLALEGLCTQQGWREGHRFSDKDAALVALTQLSLDTYPSCQVKLLISVATALSSIAALDYPTDAWTSFIQQRAAAAVTISRCATGDTVDSSWLFLNRLSQVAYRNGALWWYLSNDVATTLMREGVLAPVSSSRAEMLTFLLHLLQRRARPSEENELATPQNCFLLSNEFSTMIMTELQGCGTTVASRCHSVSGSAVGVSSECPPPELLREISLLAALAQRLMRSEDAAATAFSTCASLLVTLQPYYSNGCLAETGDAVEGGASAGSVIENCLECILSVLQTYPDVSSTSAASALLSCLLFFMSGTGPDQLDDDTTDLEAVLAELLSDEETVPLGCEGGDVAAVACSVLELFLDANRTQLHEACSALLAFAKSQSARDGAQQQSSSSPWRALSRALGSIARVCEEADVAFVSALPQSHVIDLLETFALALSGQDSPTTSCLLVCALCKCFALGGPPELLGGWHSVLSAVFDAWLSRAGAGCREAQYVFCVVLWALGHLLRTRDDGVWLATVSADELVQWRARAFWVLHNTQSALIVGSVGQVCLEVARLTTAIPLGEHDWVLFCQTAARVCSVKAVSTLLKDILTTSLRLECVAETGQVPRTAALAMHVAGCVSELDAAQGSLVLRALSQFTVELVRGARNSPAQLQRFDPFLITVEEKLIHFCAADAVASDDVSCRCFVCALAAVSITRSSDSGGDGDAVVGAYDATARLGIEAHEARCGFLTLHTVGSALCAQATAHPPVLARPATLALMNTVFGASNWMSADRPVAGFTGCTLLLSLWLLRDPSRCTAISGLQTNSSEALTPAAFGWWASLAAFNDEIGVVFFLAACAKLLCMTARAGPVMATSLSQPLKGNTVYALPSFRARKATRVARDVSVFGSVSCGLAFVRARWMKATKVPSNDALTLTGRMCDDAWCALRFALQEVDLPVPAATSPLTITDVAAAIHNRLSNIGLSAVATEGLQFAS